LKSGLPDGIFSNLNSQFGKIVEERCWYILWPFGKLSANLFDFVASGIFCGRSV
jgi:hypothetical protein